MIKFLNSLRDTVMPYTVRAALGLTRRQRDRFPDTVIDAGAPFIRPFRNDFA